MTKRVFIIHGWDFTPHLNWYPWLEEQLIAQDYEVHVPTMPDTAEPNIELWVEELANQVGEIREDDCFIGHSIGCQTIMRYLSTLPSSTKIAGCIFVAGWFKLANLEDANIEEIAQPWLNIPVNLEKIKNFTSNWKVFISDNDPYNCIDENKRIFEEKLGAKVSIIEGAGHFTSDDGIEEIPEVLDEIL